MDISPKKVSLQNIKLVLDYSRYLYSNLYQGMEDSGLIFVKGVYYERRMKHDYKGNEAGNH